MIAAVPGQTAERRDAPDLVRAETIKQGHGRIEIRGIQVRTQLPARLDRVWPGLKAICRVKRIARWRPAAAEARFQPAVPSPLRRDARRRPFTPAGRCRRSIAVEQGDLANRHFEAADGERAHGREKGCGHVRGIGNILGVATGETGAIGARAVASSGDYSIDSFRA